MPRPLREHDAELAEAVEEVREAIAEAGQPKLQPFWDAVEAQYEKVKAMSPQSVSSDEWFRAHEKLAELTLTLRDRVGVETGVILDPGAETLAAGRRDVPPHFEPRNRGHARRRSFACGRERLR